MTLYKRLDGRIRDDSFTTAVPSGYVVSPLTRYELTGTALKMNRDSVDDVRVLVDLPGPCAIEVTANYTPSEVGDSGGLILFADAGKTSEFLEQVDNGVAQTVSRWRTKSDDGKDWDFYADSGSGFNFIDSVLEFEPKKVGVVLKKGNGAGFVPLLLQRITITASDTLIVANVSAGMTVELLDESNAVVVSASPQNSVVSLLLPRLLVTGKLRIKNGSTLIEEVSGTFAGGDRYDVGSALKIIKDPTTKEEFSVTDLTDIGVMTNGVLTKKLYLYNPSGAAANNVNLLITAYNALFGYQWADVAKDVSGVAGAYGDIISYTTIAGNASVAFWLRVVQGSDYTGLDPLRFYLELQHV